MSKLPKLNRALFNKIKRHIIAEPLRYNQGVSCAQNDSVPCGTEGCILGWGYLLSHSQRSWKSILRREEYGELPHDLKEWTAKKLGMTSDEADAMWTVNNQTNLRGKKGVKEAIKKIDLILKDREKFVAKYGVGY